MRTALTRRLAAGAAATALTLGLASAAIANPPSNVSVGGSNAPGTHAFVATDVAGFTFDGSGVSWSCTDVSFGSTNATTDHLTSGPAVGNPIAQFATSTWAGGASSGTGCAGPLGLCMTLTQNSTWDINLTGTPSGGKVTGTITNIDMTWSDCDYDGDLCSFTVTGSLDGRWDSATQNLTVGDPDFASNLVIQNPNAASNCLGLVPDNSSLSLGGVFHVTSPDGPVVIGNATSAPPLPSTVTVGASSSGNHGFTATDASGITVDTSGVTMSCDDVTFGSADTSTDHIAAGSSVANPVAEFATSSWAGGASSGTGCAGPLGLCMTLTQHGTWGLNLTGTPSGGKVTDDVSNISMTWSDCDLGGALCSFTVTGSIEGQWDNATQEVTLGGPDYTSNLIVHNPDADTNCFGLIPDWSLASFGGVFHVTSPDGVINIS